MSNDAPNLMGADEFERVAATCKRWEARSIQIVRELLVDGNNLSMVAEKHAVTMQHASVLRRRFNDKAAINNSAADFMKQVKPAGIEIFKPFKQELNKLKHAGYTVDQMLQFLELNGLKTTAALLNEFLNPKGKK